MARKEMIVIESSWDVAANALSMSKPRYAPFDFNNDRQVAFVGGVANGSALARGA